MNSIWNVKELYQYYQNIKSLIYYQYQRRSHPKRSTYKCILVFDFKMIIGFSPILPVKFLGVFNPSDRQLIFFSPHSRLKFLSTKQRKPKQIVQNNYKHKY